MTTLTTLTLTLALLAQTSAPRPSLTWQDLPSLPTPTGLAAPFAGISHNSLLLAGGANFPNKKPWEGGTKVWHNQIFLLDPAQKQWRRIATLPHPLAYGLSISHNNSLICIGGSDSTRHYPDTFRLEYRDHQLLTTPLPPLPHPIANACGTLVDNHIYLLGGQESPTSTKALDTLYTLDLSANPPTWRTLPPCPGGPRILATAASHNNSLYIFGGASLSPTPEGKPKRTYLTDTWQYHPTHGWTRGPDLPHPVVAAPSPAPTDQDSIYLLGGDDGTLTNTPPQNHPGFKTPILRLDTRTHKFETLPAPPHPLPVTTPAIPWQNSWIIPTGEIRPGIRTPAVRSVTLPTRNSSE